MKPIYTYCIIFAVGFLCGALWFKSCGISTVTTTRTVHDTTTYHVEHIKRDTAYINRWRVIKGDSIHGTTIVAETTITPVVDTSKHYTGKLIDASESIMLEDSATLRMLYFDRLQSFGYEYQKAPTKYEQVTKTVRVNPIITHGVIMGAVVTPDGSVRLGVGYGLQFVIGTIL